MKTQMLRFAMSGVAGYIVDSIVLYTVMALGMGFLRGRLVSFVCAVIATFILNRRYTFAEQLRSAPGLRPPLWLEFGRYIAAMALGGLLNLATYWFVLRVTPHFPALFALAVAAGSLVGMGVNFASAKWWVFVQRSRRNTFVLPGFELTTARCLILVQAVFWIGHLTEMTLPGLYMDAVNPDYLAARTLNPELPNPVWIQPTIGLPVLGSLYHGVQNYYVGLPVFALLGFNMLALRVAQGLFAAGILVMTQLVLQRASGSLLLAFAGALGVATELAFIASFRTQMYIVMAGVFWLLLAIYLALGRRNPASVPLALSPAASTNSRGFPELPTRPWFFSGVCAGLAVYSYFVFLFFVPVFVALGWWHTRNWRSAWIWLLGFALGMQTYVLGYTLAIIDLGGFAPALEWLRSSTQGLDPMSSELTLAGRLANAWSLMVITLQSIGNELMIFGTAQPGTWAVWKVRLLASVPLLLTALGVARGWKQRGRPEAGMRVDGLLASWHVALLPLSFIALSLVFGNRLWSHHFTPLIPLSYLVLFLAVHQLQSTMRLALPKWAGLALMSVFLVGNLQQQQVFFDRLVATGGTGYLSNAVNRMADDALSMPAEVVHVFPEWGFGMPFAFLTGNRRTYETDIGDTNLQRLAAAGTTLRVYYWKPETESSYRDTLQAQGYRISSSGAYLQRDQKPAFYWLEAAGPGSAR
jgi:putative flippase GtrA